MDDFIKVTSSINHIDGVAINLRCPSCHRLATLDKVPKCTDLFVSAPAPIGQQRVGYRICPNRACGQLIVVLHHVVHLPNSQEVKVDSTYPHERIDFEATNIPKPIVNALEEAITCHASGCNIAAAIMVRKTLEELCKDQKATGKRLIDQIQDLKNKVVVPVGILNGIDNLRLLGNDAAHIELKEFDQIGSEEVEVGILFAKELLKAVYQSSLLADRLNALKK